MQGIEYEGDELTDNDNGNISDDVEDEEDEEGEEPEEEGGDEEEEEVEEYEEEKAEADKVDKDDDGEENEDDRHSDDGCDVPDEEFGEDAADKEGGENTRDDMRHDYLSSLLSVIEEEDYRAHLAYLLRNPDEDKDFVIHSEEEEYRLQVEEDDHDL